MLMPDIWRVISDEVGQVEFPFQKPETIMENVQRRTGAYLYYFPHRAKTFNMHSFGSLFWGMYRPHVSKVPILDTERHLSEFGLCFGTAPLRHLFEGYNDSQI
ncbi:hypothetical protein FKW77_003353 [Venturia effusa]|uniref:Uncharacterized protein n=1 Tax=Venturia effusa TaxID=50376 RepID=A0A517LL55_9PEZI|nr:hypothetical protein FKW77_003353 [Venturia effusa]